MPKRIQSIEHFAAGIISDADQEDVPAEAAVYSENIDPDGPAGLIRGVRGDSVYLSTEIGSEELLKADTVTVGGTDWTVLATKSGSNCKLYVYDGTTVSDITGTLTINYSADHDLVVLDKAAFFASAGSVFWIGNMDGRTQFSTSLSGWTAEKLSHTWSAGISASNDAASGLSASNALATKGAVKTYNLTLSDGVSEEQRQVTLEVEPEGQELAGTKKLFFAVSPVYDGYINGPLKKLGSISVSGSTTAKRKKDLDALSAGDWYFAGSGERVRTTIDGVEELDTLGEYFSDIPHVNSEVDFKLFADTSSLSQRITGFDLYAATSTDPNATEPDGSYRYVKQIHTSDAGWTGTTMKEIWVNINLLDANGPTFEGHAGVSEEITDPRVDWRLGTDHQNYLFGTQADAPSGASGENWRSFLVRSRPYQYGIFDWSKDFLVLPIEPKAIESYGSRVYAFTDNEFVRINPDTLEVEDRFRGAGAHHHRAVVSTQRGLFFANADNCFHFDGATLRTIGDPIRHIDYSEGEGWAEAFTSSKATVVSPNGDLVVFARGPTSGNTKYFVWDARREVWHIIVSDFTTLRGAYAQGGSAFISGYDAGAAAYKLYQLFDKSASRRSWTWVSQQLSMDSPRGRHKVYEVRLSGDTPAVRLAQNGEALSATTALGLPTSEKGYHAYPISSYIQGSRTQARIEGAAADEVRGCSIVYRPIRTP